MRNRAILLGLITGAAAGVMLIYFVPNALHSAPLPTLTFVAGLFSAYAIRLLAGPAETTPPNPPSTTPGNAVPPAAMPRFTNVNRQFLAWALACVLAGIAIGLAIRLTPSATGLGAIVAALGAATLIATAVWRIFALNEPIAIESDWGALGQSMGGWRIAPAAALLLAGLVVAGLATTLVIVTSNAAASSQPPKAPK